MNKNKKIVFVRLTDDEAKNYNKAFKKSGLRQQAEFIRMLISRFLKGE